MEHDLGMFPNQIEVEMLLNEELLSGRTERTHSHMGPLARGQGVLLRHLATQGRHSTGPKQALLGT